MLYSYSRDLYIKDENKKNKMHISFRTEILIKDGQLDEFEKLVQEMCEVVKKQEPDTINYQYYPDTDNTKCIVNETYKDSNAAFIHMNGINVPTNISRYFQNIKYN